MPSPSFKMLGRGYYFSPFCNNENRSQKDRVKHRKQHRQVNGSSWGNSALEPLYHAAAPCIKFFT